MSSPIPPVSVTFTVAGDDAIVRAAKRVQLELDRTGKTAAGAVEGTSFLEASLKKLATAYTAFRVARFIGDSIEAAASLHELSQRTGATVEALSTLAFAGRRAGVSSEEIAAGFRGLSLSLGQLRDGGSDAVEAFQSIGLSADDLRGLSVDQVFKKVVDALDRLPPGFDKAEAASKVFGRSGAALIPLLSDLANGGLKKAGDDARRFGALVTEQGATAADNFTDSLGDAKGALSGFAREVASPVLPALTELLHTLTLVVAKAKELPGIGIGNFKFGLDKLGEQIHNNPRFGGSADGGFRGHGAGGRIPDFVEPPITDKQIEALVKLRTAGRATPAELATLRKALAQLNAQLAKTADPVLRAKVIGQVEGIEAALTRNPLRDARLAAQKDAIAQRLAAEQQGIKAQDQINQAQYAQGLESLQDYYAKRKQSIVDGMNAEMAALAEQLKLVEGRQLKGNTAADRQADAATRQAEADAIRARMEVAQRSAQLGIAENDDEQTRALRDLTQQRLQAEQQVQEAQGNTLQAALIGIEQEVQKRRELLAKDGSLTPEQRGSDVQKLQSLLTLRAQVAEVDRQVGLEMSAMDRDRARIQDQITTGQMSEKAGAEEIARLERQRLPTLQRLAAEAMRLANAVGDPALVDQAKALSSQLETIAANADLAGQRAAQFKSSVSQSLGDSLTSLITDDIGKLGDVTSSTIEPAVDKAGNLIKDRFGNTVEKVTEDVYDLGDAFVDTLRRIAQGIQQIAAQSLSQSLSNSFFKLLGGAAGGVTFSPLAFAAGGPVPGYGSGDTVPAMLTPGEFVVNKDATARHFGLLAEINQGIYPVRPVSYGRQHFNTGGLVTTSAGGSSTVELLVPEGWGGRVISDDDVVRVVVKNRRAVGKALGVKG